MIPEEPASWHPSSDNDPAIVSCGERSLWCLDQLQPTSPAYNVGAVINIRGVLPLGTIAAAFDRIASRHEAFRTYFDPGDGTPRRRLTASRLRAARVDLSGLPNGAQEERLNERLQQDVNTEFRLHRAPLARVTIVRRSASHHLAIVCLHHIICDGWSLRVLLQELFLHCAAAVRGDEVEPGATPLQARHFAAWETRFLRTPAAPADLAYWCDALASARFEPFSLASARFAPATAAHFQCDFENLSLRAVDALARMHAATPFAVVLSAIAIASWLLSGRRQLLLGVDFSNRDRLGAYEIVGLLVNQVPVIVHVDPDTTFASLLEDVERTLTAAARHSAMPFERILELVQPARSSDHLGVLRTKVVDRGHLTSPLAAPGCELAPQTVPTAGVKYELAIFVERGPAPRLVYEYDAGAIPTATITAHAATVTAVLRRLSLASSLSVRELAGGAAA